MNEEEKIFDIEINKDNAIEILGNTLKKFEVRSSELYMLKKAIKYILADYDKILKENQQLKELIAHKNEYTKQLEEDLFENCNNYVIPIKKIEEKICEYKTRMDKLHGASDIAEIEMLEDKIETLQELLEKENKIK